MYKKFLFTLLALFSVPSFLFAQIEGFSDTFEDGTPDTTWSGSTHTLWSTSNGETYNLSEENGVLKIDFSQDKNSGTADKFVFNPPEYVDISKLPRVKLRIKSNQQVNLTLQVQYSFIPGFKSTAMEFGLPGDNKWHSYSRFLEDEYYKEKPVREIYVYLERGNNDPKEANIALDDFSIGGTPINVSALQASVESESQVELNWSVSDSDAVAHYNVYRSNETRFKIEEQSKVGDTTATTYVDNEVESLTQYYYKITAVDTAGNEYLPSDELKVEVLDSDVPPAVSVTDVNSKEVGKYEKFEAKLSLDNVLYTNPYDPYDIDVHAWFKSPEGDTTWINGFYDDYQGVDQWKVRFSPDVIGQWEYKVMVKDDYNEGEGDKHTFTALNSEHNGWIKTSHNNPHYFMYDDSTTFYGTAVYSPWGNTQSRFENFAEHDVNIFALWNINYGGFVNGHGLFENELGRYNQTKAGRLDSLLNILEKDDIKLMYGMWPHDLFSKTVWATQWQNNPYNQLIDVEEVYSDSLVWEYQKQQYRYLIARYGHSRSLGIWEIINEMNGTDGWQQGRRQEAINWVGKVHEYFKEHDPYDHPTTANFSGGYNEYRPPLYELNDVPNIHIYESQGWPKQYSDDDLRSSFYNYGWASRRFWNNFEKPAIFGEAGASHTYIDPESSDYSLLFHNAIWASLSNGLASTPVWWSYNRLNNRDWDHLKYLGDFTSQIDFAHINYDLVNVWAKGSDAYGMADDTLGFGWLRSYVVPDVSGTEVGVSSLIDGTYRLQWYNTWSGDTVRVDTLVSAAGLLKAKAPQLSEARKDIAYSVDAIENATESTRLNVFIKSADVEADSDSSYTVVAYISDNKGRLAVDATNQINFSLTGPGELDKESATAQNGIVTITYHPEEGSAEGISITAEAEGLNSVTFNQKFASAIESNGNIEQPTQYKLMDNYPNPFNPSTNIAYHLPESGGVTLEVFDITGQKIATLVDETQSSGQHQLTYNAGNLSSGTYLYRLKVENFNEVKRMMLIK